MKDVDQSMLIQIKKVVKDSEPKAKIYLYGSRSRGTASLHSDWDILILVSKDKVSPEDERNIAYALYDLEFDSGEVISPLIYSETEWNNKHKFTPFYRNVMKEGRLL
jgi:uncharacterized protein